ncbi:MAG: hypothetical protein ABL974_05690 [Prosthecobacter sp.]
MRETIQNLILLHPQNFILEVYVAMGLAYLVLAILCVADIQTSKESVASRLTWSIAVVAIPLLGMYAYATVSMFNADLTLVKRFGFGVPKANKR